MRAAMRAASPYLFAMMSPAKIVSDASAKASRGSLFRRTNGGAGFERFIPEPEAAVDGVAVGAKNDVAGKFRHELGITPTEKNGVADHRGLETDDDVEHRFLPTLFATCFEACETNVLFVGFSFF